MLQVFFFCFRCIGILINLLNLSMCFLFHVKRAIRLSGYRDRSECIYLKYPAPKKVTSFKNACTIFNVSCYRDTVCVIFVFENIFLFLYFEFHNYYIVYFFTFLMLFLLYIFTLLVFYLCFSLYMENNPILKHSQVYTNICMYVVIHVLLYLHFFSLLLLLIVLYLFS